VLQRTVAWLDGFQQRHRLIGFPLAVRQKYAEDQGGYLAATVAYYGFFSVFPLLLILTTGLGYLLAGHPGLQRDLVDSALGQFPVVGRDLKAGSLKGSALAVGIGAAGALWAGMGAVLAAENAFNQMWGVPYVDRPSFLRARLRALGLLVVLGGGIVGATALAGVATADSHFAVALKVVSIALSTGLDFVLFWSIFRLLVAADVSWRDLRAGAAVAAVGYELLQLAGGYYVGHVLQHASNTYGTFALVIGLLSYIYLAIHVVLLGAEASVVAARRLWPRSLSLAAERPPTPADVAAFEQRLSTEVRRRDEHVVVSPPPAAE
jgi:membrane protein